jgi:hypothetical protein
MRIAELPPQNRRLGNGSAMAPSSLAAPTTRRNAALYTGEPGRFSGDSRRRPEEDSARFREVQAITMRSKELGRLDTQAEAPQFDHSVMHAA